jgi:hypothetical protein
MSMTFSWPIREALAPPGNARPDRPDGEILEQDLERDLS